MNQHFTWIALGRVGIVMVMRDGVDDSDSFRLNEVAGGIGYI